MFQVLYNFQCVRHGLVTFQSFDVDHCTDTAVIVLKSRVIQSLALLAHTYPSRSLNSLFHLLIDFISQCIVLP